MKRRLLATVALLFLLFLLLLLGVERSARSLRAREEARGLVAAALAEGRDPERQAELFRRARETDAAYEFAPCQQAVELERRERYAEAAAGFEGCLKGDPRQIYAHLGYAKSLLRARGSDAYVEVRSALRRFLEKASEDPVASRDPVSRRAAEELVFDLEELLEQKNPHRETRRYAADEIRRILLREPLRGSSRYEGSRVPLRLGFRPGDAVLGTAAEEQLREVARALRDGSLAGSRIQIEGHTDSVEGRTRTARSQISLRRAQAVKDFLVRRCGIPAGDLTVTGFADNYPYQPNDTEAGRAANRRVELVNLTTRELVRGDVREEFRR